MGGGWGGSQNPRLRSFCSYLISTICSQLRVSASQELSGDARCLGNHLKTFFGTRNRLKTPSKHKISAPAAGKLDKKTFRFFYNSDNCNSYFFVLIVAAFVLKGHNLQE